MTHFTPFTQNFLQSILSSIDSKDPVVANAWLDTLLDVIDLLPVEVLAREVLAIAISKAQDSQPTFSRLGSCQLIGKLGLKLEQKIIQDELIPIAQNLSQDSEWTIRASMCSQLLSVLKGLTKSGENTEAKVPVRIVLSILFELADDEIEAVRLVVIETVSTLLQYLDKESVNMLMIPFLQRISERALKAEDKTLPLLAQHWARISRTVQSHLTDTEKEWFVEFYYSLTSLGSAHNVKDKALMPDIVADTDNGQKLEIYAEVRHACAVNSAAMVPFIGVELFIQRLSSLRALSVDPYFVVRRAVAANVLELCRFLGKAMHPLFNQLLVDPCVDVTCALVPQVGAVIEHLARLGPLSPFVDERVVVETCGAVLRCEEQVMNGSSWRMQADMLSQLAALPLCLPCNAVHDLLLPRLWQRIETMRPLPCRVSAAQTLMLCVRSERRKQERIALCSAIINKLASAPSCHGRMLFLRVCPILFDLLSRKFIRKEFFLPLVRLAGDKVANVRLRFATLLPRLHISLRGLDVESEKRLIVELDSTVRWLVETEKDRDVKDELANFFRWVEEQERCGRADPDHQKRMQQEEEADRRKEEEEKLIEDLAVGSQSQSTVERMGSDPSTTQLRPAFFPSEPDSSEQDNIQQEQTPSSTSEKSISLDPSTDDFYRDAGVRLAETPSTSPSGMPMSGVADQPRNPSIQSKLKQPSIGLVKTSAALPHFGIARGVQQVQPQPSMAYGLTPTTPAMRVQRRSPGAQLDAVKSRSQENLSVPPPRPKANRPMSTCLGTNDLLSQTTTNKAATPFSRTRLRASIGGPASSSTKAPISALPPRSDLKWNSNRSSLVLNPKTTGSVKLSDMKNALPITPIPPRKVADNQTTLQFGRRKQPVEKPAEKPSNNGSSSDGVEEATRAMESLDLGTITRLRRPAAAGGSKLLESLSSAESSPLQRRNPWRRSLNFSTATSSPPPPPPRKNYATLPRNMNAATPSTNNNNNNNNNNSTNNNNPSKLPVPAFKRGSFLGSNT